MSIAYNKGLNLHRRSNTPSRVARVFECNSVENMMSHYVQKGQTLTCVSKLYVDLQDYILNNSQNMVLHMHFRVVILMHGHCTVTTLMHGHCTGIARASHGSAWSQHGMHAHHTAHTHITRQTRTSHGT